MKHAAPSSVDLPTLLLLDAIDQVALSPTLSHNWHLLMERYNARATDDARAFLLRALPERTPADGVAGFLRATFIANLTRSHTDLAAAGELAATLSPVDVNRIMAYANYEWGCAVRDCRSHADFHATLRAARVPELMRLAGEQLRAQTTTLPAPRPITALRRVAVLAPDIGSMAHPPTGMALEQLQLLADQGLEVRLFSCQETHLAGMEHYLGSQGIVLTSMPDLPALAARLPAGVSMALGDSQLSHMLRWQLMLAILAEYDPDLIMFVGMCSPLVLPLYERRPVLGLSVHALAPVVPVDVWLTAQASRAGLGDSSWGPTLPPAFGHYHPYRVRLQPEGAPLARAALQLAPDQLAMISIGARLSHEITPRWATRMLDVLARHPHLVWVLLGGPGTLPPALAQANPEQLRLISNQPGARNILRCCDLYVNPPRVGGGLSAAEAMAEGLPVLALMGGDAGSKLDELAQPDEDAYFAELEALLTSPARRRASGDAMRARFDERLNLENSAASLRQACLTALARFHERAPS